MKNKTWGYTAAIVSAVMFGLHSIISKLMYLRGLTPLQLNMLQSCSASTILLIGGWFLKKHVFTETSRNTIIRLAILGLVGLLPTGLLLYPAYELLDASVAMVIFYAYPAIVTVAGVLFFKKKLSTRIIVALTIAIGGVILSSGIFPYQGISEMPVKGILLTLGAACAYSFYIVYGEHNLDDVEPWTVCIFAQMFSTLGLLFIHPPWTLFGNMPDLVNIAFAAGMAMFTSIIPLYLLLTAIKYIGGSAASIIGTVELPATLLFAFLVLSESVTIWNYIGVGLIILGIYFIDHSETPKEEVTQQL